MRTLKTICEEELSIEGTYTQLQELLKAQNELQGFSKQNPALGQNQNYQRILNQLSLNGQGLAKSLQALIARKKQEDVLKQKASQQSGQVTNITQPTKTAQPQTNITPTRSQPTAANGMLSNIPRRTA